jgi:hypothetical protein
VKEKAVRARSFLLPAEREDVMESYIVIWYRPLVIL